MIDRIFHAHGYIFTIFILAIRFDESALHSHSQLTSFKCRCGWMHVKWVYLMASDIIALMGCHCFVNDSVSVQGFFLCDGIKDCINNEDELHCLHSMNIIYPSQICKIVFSGNLTDFEWACPLSLSYKKYSPCFVLSKNLSTLTFNLLTSLDKLQTRKTEDLCIYEPNDCSMNNTQTNGENLISCKHHKCDRNYFKCHNFYCIPWRLVCSGQWECPGGSDEMYCETRTCHGMFKCRSSSLCIAKGSVCDHFDDCPFTDDEMFCDMSKGRQTCPTKCSCLLLNLVGVIKLVPPR